MALLAEFIIAFWMMSTVLALSSHQRLGRYTGVVVGLLVIFVTLESRFRS